MEEADTSLGSSDRFNLTVGQGQSGLLRCQIPGRFCPEATAAGFTDLLSFFACMFVFIVSCEAPVQTCHCNLALSKLHCVAVSRLHKTEREREGCYFYNAGGALKDRV